MCGRFTLSANPHAVAALCNLPDIPELVARYNVSPSQRVAAVRQSDGSRSLTMLKWGLIPSWSKDPKIAFSLINARGETAATKPAFRSAFKRRRCLIPADGFYEWKKEGKLKLPYHFRMADASPFAFAGLWESWSPPDGDAVETCTIVTTESNDHVKPFHDRMPVILKSESFDRWLDPLYDRTETLSTMLAPYPSGEMTAVPVSTRVNSPQNEGPECLVPAD